MRKTTILLAALALTVASCQRLGHAIADESHGPAWEHHEGAHAEPIEDVEQYTADIPVVPVHDGDFFVAARTPLLEQAPCTQCHGKGEVNRPEDSPRPAHWTIKNAHGDAGFTCDICHPSDKPETLRTIEDEEVELDHSYELCGTCHFEQLEDWRGGAHGKRLAAWSGDRVVQACTGCHNPHEPSFPVRMPATFTPPPNQPTGDTDSLGEKR